MADWRSLARAMATGLPDEVPRHWRAAVAAVPRHVLVPEFRLVEGDRHDLVPAIDALAHAYQDRVLFVGRDREHVLDQSRAPSSLLRLFEATDLRPGHRVLVVGIDSGYDVALLAHVLGDAAVFAVDPDPAVVALARTRLAEAGHWPTLDIGWGMPAYGPFDRILVTDEVRTVRWEWAGQLPPHGLLGVDITIGRAAGGRFLLRREDDRLTGRFADTFRGRGADRRLNPLPAPNRVPHDRADAVEGSTALGVWPHTADCWLVCQAAAPRPGLTIGGGGMSDRMFLADSDGSWAEVEVVEQDRRRAVRTDPDVPPHGGPRRTWQGGPGRLWDELEHAQRVWTELGSPDWSHYGVTVTGHRQWLWVDTAADTAVRTGDGLGAWRLVSEGGEFGQQ